MRLNQLLRGAAVNVGGRLSWKQVESRSWRKVDLVISGNTGVMHIAAALSKKQVALHGPTNPMIWSPLNSKAVVVSSPCRRVPCLKIGF